MSWRKGPPPPPSKPVAGMPERLQVFDLPDWLEPGGDAAVEVDARAAYARFEGARRRWYAEHELPPIAEAAATPDEPFDGDAVLMVDGVRVTRAELTQAHDEMRADRRPRPL